MTSREFLYWLKYFKVLDKQELDRTEKIEWYLAQIALEIVRKDWKPADAKKLKLHQFILFGEKAKKRAKKTSSPAEMFAGLNAVFGRVKAEIEKKTPDNARRIANP